MNVLLIGGGGREHALAWKIVQSPMVEQLFCAPGNPGIAGLARTTCVPVSVLDFDGLRKLRDEKNIGLIVVGPEDPLAAGVVDALGTATCRVFGPSAAAAQLEASKSFAKDFMQRWDIPTAAYAAFDDADAAMEYVRAQGAPIVVKADGLAAGKGVTVAMSVAEAEEAIREAMLEGAFGAAGGQVVIEEFMEGEEASLLAFCDGRIAVPMAGAQDHKRAFDGDEGPNTGGMGAYSPAPVLSAEMLREVQEKVLDRAMAGMAADGMPYKGVLYAGLMITATGVKVVEFNCRFGDPETQVVLPRMTSDIVPVFIACCDGGLDPAMVGFDEGACVTVVMASGGYPKAYPKGSRISGIAEAEALAGVCVFHAGTAMAGADLVTNGGRVLTVTAVGGDLRETIDRAYAAVERIHFEPAHFRRDIGHRALARG